MKNLHVFIVTFVIMVFLTGCDDDFPEYIQPARLSVDDSIALATIWQETMQYKTEETNKWNLEFPLRTAVDYKLEKDTINNKLIVTELTIVGDFKEGTKLSSAIFRLKDLKKLYITTDIEYSIPQEISQLTKLQHLTLMDMNDGGIYGSIPDAIVELQDLEYLKIDGENITGELPSGLGKLQKIKYIIINNTNITGSIPLSFANFKNRIVYLDLGYNRLCGIFPSEVLGPNVIYWCWQNFFTELPFEIWRDDNNAYPPMLRYNHLSGVIPEWVKNTNKWNKYGVWSTGLQLDGYGYINYH